MLQHCESRKIRSYLLRMIFELDSNTREGNQRIACWVLRTMVYICAHVMLVLSRLCVAVWSWRVMIWWGSSWKLIWCRFMLSWFKELDWMCIARRVPCKYEREGDTEQWVIGCCLVFVRLSVQHQWGINHGCQVMEIHEWVFLKRLVEWMARHVRDWVGGFGGL